VVIVPGVVPATDRAGAHHYWLGAAAWTCPRFYLGEKLGAETKRTVRLVMEGGDVRNGSLRADPAGRSNAPPRFARVILRFAGAKWAGGS